MDPLRLNLIEEAIEDFKAGQFVIVVDDEDRENEGDLIIAAEKITAEKVNFMLKYARGVLCAPITIERCKELELPHQVEDNTYTLIGLGIDDGIDPLFSETEKGAIYNLAGQRMSKMQKGINIVGGKKILK